MSGQRGNCESTEHPTNQSIPLYYFAVAIGRRPSLYSDREEAKAQVEHYSGCECDTFTNVTAAMAYMLLHGIHASDVHLFKRAFTANGTFEPDTTRSFKEEFAAYAKTQQ